MLSSYPNYIYFYHLNKFAVIPAYPDSITDTMSSTFKTTEALGRTSPVFTYSNSGPRTVNVTLNFHRNLMDEINMNTSNLKDNVVDFSGDDYVDTLIKYLQASALPRYSSNSDKSIIPPMVAIRFGDEIFIKGVVSSSGVSCTYRKPILNNKKYAFVEVIFSVTETEPFDADAVVSDGSFRGISKTFKDGIYNSVTSSPSINESNLISYTTAAENKLVIDKVEIPNKVLPTIVS